MPDRGKKRKIIVTVGVVSLAICALASEVLAQPGFDRRSGPGRMMGVMRNLDLTDEQHNQIRRIAERYHESGSAQRKALRQARQALRHAAMTDAVNESEIRDAASPLASLEADVAVQRAYMHAEILQVLTPDQRAELKVLRAEREARRGSFRGPKP